MMFNINGKEWNPAPKKPNFIGASSHAVTVVDAEEDASAVQRLDYETWLPFAAEVYKISKRIEDYVLVTTPICPALLPNRNGIGFPLHELTKFQPPPIARMSYKAWTGCPVHLEHDNEVHERAYGVVLDASLHKIFGYGQGQLWKVMGLLAIDKVKHPEMAYKVLKREYNTYSMGALVDSFSCSYCNAPFSKRSHCSHLNPRADIDWNEVRDSSGNLHIAYRNAHGIQPIEVSIVASPAWTTALSDTVTSMADV